MDYLYICSNDRVTPGRSSLTIERCRPTRPSWAERAAVLETILHAVDDDKGGAGPGQVKDALCWVGDLLRKRSKGKKRTLSTPESMLWSKSIFVAFNDSNHFDVCIRNALHQGGLAFHTGAHTQAGPIYFVP